MRRENGEKITPRSFGEPDMWFPADPGFRAWFEGRLAQVIEHFRLHRNSATVNRFLATVRDSRLRNAIARRLLQFEGVELGSDKKTLRLKKGSAGKGWPPFGPLPWGLRFSQVGQNSIRVGDEELSPAEFINEIVDVIVLHRKLFKASELAKLDSVVSAAAQRLEKRLERQQ